MTPTLLFSLLAFLCGFTATVFIRIRYYFNEVLAASLGAGAFLLNLLIIGLVLYLFQRLLFGRGRMQSSYGKSFLFGIAVSVLFSIFNTAFIMATNEDASSSILLSSLLTALVISIAVSAIIAVFFRRKAHSAAQQNHSSTDIIDQL